jgi:hypothetical protein
MSLTRQSVLGALAAAYVSPLVLFWFDLVWRVHTGADESMCGIDASAFCTIAETFGAFLFTFLWALYALPFALLITLPSAFILGRMAPAFERKFEQPKLASIQYGLAASVGVIAAFILDVATSGTTSFTWVAGLIGGLCGAWVFRRKRYFGAGTAAPR